MESNENGPYTWWIGGHDYLPLVSNIIFRNVERIMKLELAGILTPMRNQKLNSSPQLFLRGILPLLVYVSTIYLPSTTITNLRTWIGMPIIKMFLLASETTKCLWCKTNNKLASHITDTIWTSWDTRSPLDPKVKVEAHESEILAVAFSPANEHLLVTGSADKVCITRKRQYCCLIH